MKLQISLFALVVGATAQSTIINDLTQKISPQVTTLKSDVDAVPQSGLTGGLAVNNDLQTLSTTFDDATNDATTASFSLDDGQTILADWTPVAYTLAGTLETLLTKKADLQGLGPIPLDRMVLTSLQSLNQSTMGYTDVLIHDAPTSQEPTFTAIKDRLVLAFDQAITGYEA